MRKRRGGKRAASAVNFIGALLSKIAAMIPIHRTGASRPLTPKPNQWPYSITPKAGLAGGTPARYADTEISP
jgi:hypothetical protein